eukprot:symbB.v1.2.011304.t1/scaffold755.1/size165019/2
MKVGFHLDTEANIEMQVHGIKLGINRMFLKGDLLIRLEPLIDELPVIGGIVACFLNQPELEFHYSGLAARVDSNILRQLLQSAVAKAMVLPHAVTIPIGTEEQNVDRALLDPAPVGVLRIWALSASDLPSSWPLGSRSRSPYMYVSLETEEWQTSVVYHSTSPQWNQKHDFLVFDKRQEVQVKIFDIFDSNSLFTRNVIAAALPIAVDDLVTCPSLGSGKHLLSLVKLRRSTSQTKNLHCSTAKVERMGQVLHNPPLQLALPCFGLSG